MSQSFLIFFSRRSAPCGSCLLNYLAGFLLAVVFDIYISRYVIATFVIPASSCLLNYLAGFLLAVVFDIYISRYVIASFCHSC